MAPLRRYLRITKHSVLEVRIYLDHPADAEAWLLRRENPALPRVIQAVRPLVLPKLREENERAKGKGGSKARKKGVKDVVVEGEFARISLSHAHPKRHQHSHHQTHAGGFDVSRVLLRLLTSNR